MVEPRWNLVDAINTILDSGVTPTDLSHTLGFQDTSMVYRYKTGKTKSMKAGKAKILYDTYNMLLDDFNSKEHLYMLADKENSKTVDVCEHIMDKLIVIASYKGADLRQKLLRFIADHDKRA